MSRRITWRGYRGRVKEGVDPSRVLALFEDAGYDLAPAGAEFVKDKLDKGSRVYRVLADLGSGPEEVFIKTVDGSLAFREMRKRMKGGASGRAFHHYPVKMAKLLRSGSVARQCWRAEAACVRAGVPVAEHVLFLVQRRGLFRREIIVTRGVAPRPGPNARAYFEALAAAPPGRSRRAEKIARLDELGRLLWKVRRSGIMFPDFKLHNLVMRERGGGFEFVVVDLAEVLPGRDFPEDVFLRHFAARLPGLSLLDRVRLARAYLEAGDDPRSWRELCPLAFPRAGDH